MKVIRALFYTVLGWAIALPTSFLMICRYEKAAGVEHGIFCAPPLWLVILALALVPVSLHGAFLIGRWSWSKSRIGAGLFAAVGLILAFVTR